MKIAIRGSLSPCSHDIDNIQLSVCFCPVGRNQKLRDWPSLSVGRYYGVSVVIGFLGAPGLVVNDRLLSGVQSLGHCTICFLSIGAAVLKPQRH